MKALIQSIRFLAGAGLLGVAILTVAGCGKSDGQPLAVVNGETISMDDFHKYLEGKTRVRVQTANGPAVAVVAESLAFQALQDMIARQVTLQMARDEGVYPSDQDVLKELEFRKKLEPNFLQKLTQNGLTVDRIKSTLALELARENLVTKGITVTPKDADDYIKANPKMFMEPAYADLLWVFVKDPAKKAKVDEALKAGQAFSVVAVQQSDFPNAREQGGRFPQRNVSVMQAPLQKMVNATAEGQTTGWLDLQDGFAKFYVEKKTPAKPMEMTPERKELVRRQLAQQRGLQAVDIEKRVLDKLLTSKVDVKERTLTEAWKRAFDRFKEEQKVDIPTGGGATPTPGG